MTTADYDAADIPDLDQASDDEIPDMELALGEDSEDLIADQGYSPPDEAGAADGFGTTLREQQTGETIDEREFQMVPDVEPGDPEGASMARRLVDTDDDGVSDTEKDLIAADVLGDGDGDLSAEETAMHVIDPDADEALATDEGSTN